MHENNRARPPKDADDTPIDGTDDLLARTLQGSMMPAPRHAPSGETVRGGSPGGILGLFDARTRKHRSVLRDNHDGASETADAMALSTFLAKDFVALALDAERSFEQAILHHRASPSVLRAAPFYTQIARQLMMEDTTAIAQAGTSRIRRKIENR